MYPAYDVKYIVHIYIASGTRAEKIYYAIKT